MADIHTFHVTFKSKKFKRKCKKCGRTFYDYQQYEQHMINHSNRDEEIKQKYEDRYKLGW